ncbi:MAG: T9SS type A sorting domain-containing protein [Candidatus Marinimicrobia bacterium]|jgi:hypothetical protein|nr:T9SS type A sorting domain-containing protein [Candidatus Neomarinimicrobiota bacterium]MBT3682690.1 T9SS type A sorting domain-containing protein [Candidatus Neomarinimicrobiota bacterium]MBT3759655.1 T9SS type A sorting domain-containing protein [Candidatus Neomarinimicrobiota bacterium]MBT3894473.1 T9SS type A sorting domain-containing protein [Candidatus Neomarinimicrobiota bacterium]MBT4172516.1 T9SS type A sorting domain-containing protein [Candidatus Neomarinimicrobiota bacterium]
MDSHVQNWADFPSVFYFVGLADIGQPYTCEQWGDAGVEGIPMIIEDPGTVFNWLHDSFNAYPTYAILNQYMEIVAKPWPYGNTDGLIQDLLDACMECNSTDLDEDGINNDVDNCPEDFNPGQEDEDSDNIGDACDDCANMPGDINDDYSLDVLDIVSIVSIILNSLVPTECQVADADFSQDGIVNVLDVIQIINTIISAPRLNQMDGIASVIVYSENEMTYINIESNIAFVGVELDVLDKNPISFELISNDHMTTEWGFSNDVNKMISYSPDNSRFDNNTAQYILSGDELDHGDINIIIGDSNGEIIQINRSNFENGFMNTPEKFELNAVYPNPFNPSTEISFVLNENMNIELSVFNAYGQKVDTIVQGYQSAGSYHFTWDASLMPSGIYFVKLASGNIIETQKAILIK